MHPPTGRRSTSGFAICARKAGESAKISAPATLTGFSLETFSPVGYPPRPASGLYPGMIAPLIPFPFRGVIWYQGENNALQAQQYRRLQPALIGLSAGARHTPLQRFYNAKAVTATGRSFAVINLTIQK